MKLTEVVKLIRGPRGTKVQLKVIPASKLEPVVYNLTRQKVELKAQEARREIIEQGKKPDGMPYRIGVIDLPSFYSDPGSAQAKKANGGDAPAETKSATEDVRKILKEFTAKGVDGVVLDLRRNGGGSLREALALTGLFIDQGAIVQVKGPEGRVQRGDDPEKGTVYAGPLVVLISRLSASASEILAGALQDYGRALIVGDSATHGKGTVQVVIDIGEHVRADPPPKLGALKLTIQQFYRVNGDSTQDRGVAADVVLPSWTDVLTGEKDLEHALKFDRVAPVKHDQWNLVPAELKTALQAQSADRVKKSPEFGKLVKQAALLKAQRDRKLIPLNEQELRDAVGKDGTEKDDVLKGEDDPPPVDAVYKFRRNYINKEILHIMEDFLQAKKTEAPAQ
jgi:carboxyl-terminal processing protease